MEKSYTFIFLDINNIIMDENEEIKEGEDLKKEIKEKFEFISSKINYFIENHILIDLEKEELFSVNKINFIYPIEKDIMQNFKFFLLRKIQKDILNIDVDALFILLDLEKDNYKKPSEEIISKIINNPKIKFYFLGIYKSKDKIKLRKETITDLFIDQEQQIDYKYTEININEDINDINEKIDKYIEEAMFDVCIDTKENNYEHVLTTKKYIDKNVSQSNSGCLLI